MTERSLSPVFFFEKTCKKTIETIVILQEKARI